MIVSTRGRYALRVMIDIAEHPNEPYIPLKSIAARQGISEKYLEAIVASLVKSGNLCALRGKKGGYRLVKEPGEYNMTDILEVTEGTFAPVACMETGKNECERYGQCKTIKMWEGLNRVLCDYFENITLEDLLNEGLDGDNYII